MGNLTQGDVNGKIWVVNSFASAAFQNHPSAGGPMGCRAQGPETLHPATPHSGQQVTEPLTKLSL